MLSLPCQNPQCDEKHEVCCIKCGAEINLIAEIKQIGTIWYVKCVKCNFKGSFTDNQYDVPDPDFFNKRGL